MPRRARNNRGQTTIYELIVVCPLLRDPGYQQEMLLGLAMGGLGRLALGTKATTKLPVPNDLPANIHIGQQGKHIRGHNNFIEGRSYFNDGVDPVELLAGVRSGKYSIIGTGAKLCVFWLGGVGCLFFDMTLNWVMNVKVVVLVPILFLLLGCSSREKGDRFIFRPIG